MQIVVIMKMLMISGDGDGVAACDTDANPDTHATLLKKRLSQNHCHSGSLSS